MVLSGLQNKMCGLSRAGRATCQTGLDNMLNMKRLKGRWKYKKTWTRKPQTVHYSINRCTYTECSGTTPKVGNLFVHHHTLTKWIGKKINFWMSFFFHWLFLFQTCTSAFEFFAVPWYETSCVVCPRTFGCFSTNNKNQELPIPTQYHSWYPDRRFHLVFRLIHADGHFSHIKEHERLWHMGAMHAKFLSYNAMPTWAIFFI